MPAWNPSNIPPQRRPAEAGVDEGERNLSFDSVNQERL